MADDLPTWPSWSDPATKSDVLRSLIFTRSCIIDVFICLAAMKAGDDAKFTQAFDALRKDDDDLRRLIDDIGGASIK